MTHSQLSALLVDLLALSRETEWLEFKHNNSNPEEIGEYISALSNSAALQGRNVAYIVWGIEDGTRKIVGTRFKPRQMRKGNEELESWLMHSFKPHIGFKIHEWIHEGSPMVLFEIPHAIQVPVAFKGKRFIRIGSYKKPLEHAPVHEKELWTTLTSVPFAEGIAKSDLAADEALALLDFATFFNALKLPVPSGHSSILGRLADEKLVVARPGHRWDITNLGAILLANNLSRFDTVWRKPLRVIKYSGDGRIETEREWRDTPSQKGYAVAFEAAVAFINSQLPQNEPIGQALRTVVRMYPEEAIRELVINALIHQDFNVTGTGPMVEIFESRLEITNPGAPLVDTLRFIDATPTSRNEPLAALARRMEFCEEAGTGIDKVIKAVEAFQLPPPNFQALMATPPGFTRVTLFAYRKLNDMGLDERIRACYHHACLCTISGKKMTNATLRQRFGIEEKNIAKASRLIKESIEAGLIRPANPDQGRKYISYVPFWA